MIIYTKLLAKFFFSLTIQSCDFNYSIQLFCQSDVFVLVQMTFSHWRLMEINNPDLTSSVESTNWAQIKFVNISLFEKFWMNNLLLLVEVLIEMEMTTLIKEVVMTTKTLTMVLPCSLLVLPNCLLAWLVVHSSLIGVWKNIVGLSHFLKHYFRGFRIIRIFIWMVLDCHFFKSAFYLVVVRISL